MRLCEFHVKCMRKKLLIISKNKKLTRFTAYLYKKMVFCTIFLTGLLFFTLIAREFSRNLIKLYF